MILVIVGLLVQLALPQYRLFVEKAQARERLSDLLSLQTQLESCYFHTMDYSLCANELHPPTSGRLEKEAQQFAYQLAIAAHDETAWCPIVSTNHRHETQHCL